MADRFLFFSIIVPAHNEEKYLAETLERIRALNYPRGRLEVIVVENGSTDSTLAVAKKFEGGGIRVLQSPRGVSRAKNLGIASASKESDWTIFLDADTHLAPSFLQELNGFLLRRAPADAAVGAVALRPIEKSHWYVPYIMSAYNVARRIMRVPFALEIMRTPLRGTVRFDETRQFAEDVQLMRDAARYGSVFFFPTRSVSTSVRRFEKVGWFKQLVLWGWQGMVLSKTTKRSDIYPVIR